MNRNELQQYSKEITRRYLQMMQELTVDTVRDPIQPDPAVDTFCYFQILELQRLPGITWRKVGMTSNHHAPYDLGYTRATMA